MSESQGGAGRREVAYRLFASEFDDADFSYSESDEERAPNYVVTPTGARVNRLFVVGVLTEIETVSEDYLRARVVDPTGPFVVYAGQYQPDALAFLERAEPPAFVAVTGKARTYQPDDSDQVFTSVRPESISEVDASTRDRWVVQTAEQSIDRVARMAEAKHSGLVDESLQNALVAHGVEEGFASGIAVALDHYGTTGEYLSTMRDLARDAARVVAGEIDEVEARTVSPDAGGDDDVAQLVERPIDTDVIDAVTESDETSESGSEGDDGEAVTAEAGAGNGSAIGTAATSETTTSAGDEDDDVAADADAAAESQVEQANESATGDGLDEGAADDADEVTETEPAVTQTTNGPQATTSADEPGVETATAETEDASESDESVGAGDAEHDVESTNDTEPTNDVEPSDEVEPSDTADTGGADDLDDFEPEFDLDEDEREEIEEEFGTEFQSGSEVDDPGAADIETPDGELDDEPAETSDAVETESASAIGSGSEPVEGDDTDDGDSTAEAVPADTGTDAADDVDLDDVDLEDAVMDAMQNLDEGDGANRDDVLAAVVERTGGDLGDVEDAIQDALMGGRCYEPDDQTLKPI